MSSPSSSRRTSSYQTTGTRPLSVMRYDVQLNNESQGAQIDRMKVSPDRLAAEDGDAGIVRCEGERLDDALGGEHPVEGVAVRMRPRTGSFRVREADL